MDIKLLERRPDTDEVLRRIGRNVVNFQYIEHLLKRLAVVTLPSAPASKIATKFAEHAASIQTSTMGALAGKVMDTVFERAPEKTAPDNIDEAWLGFRFTMKMDAEFVDRHEHEMRAVVEARNDLIHCFLPRWEAAVTTRTDAALEYLDAQHAGSISMIQRLQGWVQSMDANLKHQAAYFASKEGAKNLDLIHLRTSWLVVMLGEVALRKARPDGWAYLTTALDAIRAKAPDELKDLKRRFGLPNLQAVLEAAEFFDVADEELPNGGKRVIYCISNRYELHLPETTDTEPTKIEVRLSMG